VKLLTTARREAVASKFGLLAVASLGVVAVAAVVSMRGEFRSVLASAALCGYVYFAGRAMVLWQGRGRPSLHRPAWRRRFLGEMNEAPVGRKWEEP
jgi:hypothetical protein